MEKITVWVNNDIADAYILCRKGDEAYVYCEGSIYRAIYNGYSWRIDDVVIKRLDKLL